MHRFRPHLCALSLALLPASALAQEADPKNVVELEADRLSYDDDGQLVIAEGNVLVSRDGQRLTAGRIVYNRRTGQVEARGNVKLVNRDGTTATADKLELTESLRDGAIENILLILNDGSRMAARSGSRLDDETKLDLAVYSPCIVCTEEGKERPLWRIKSVRVLIDEGAKRVYYRDARLEFFNTPVVYLPYFSHPTPGTPKASGFLNPDIKQGRELGFQLGAPYFWNIAPDRDLTVTPTVYSSERPLLGLEYRQRFGQGPIRAGGTITYVRQRDAFNDPVAGQNELRGHVYADGQFNHPSAWRSTFQVRLTTDDTYLRRYDISNDDSLRNFYKLEHIAPRSYLNIQSWAFQGLRATDRQRLSPYVLPSIEYVWLPKDKLFGGDLDVAASAMSLFRTGGADTRRATVSAGWQASGASAIGVLGTLSARVRGDLYHSSQAARQDDFDRPGGSVYAGRNGVEARALPLASLDLRWPLGGGAFGGSQVLEPRVMLVASPSGGNSGIPNEDSRSFDLDDANLFALNRFPGYDRWEGGVRLIYGGSWNWSAGDWAVEALAGQSFRFSQNDVIFPIGTGLSGKFSDLVGRTTFSWRNQIDIVHRFRIDKGSLAVRRNEVDAQWRSKRMSINIGYSQLNRNIAIEDVQDREELRLGARVQVAKYWSLVGSTIQDLTVGRESVRNRLGIVYEDECFEFGLTYRKNFTQDRDFRRGTTFILTFKLKNL